ncbi:MAG: hypothetical protein EPN93_19435 [Spirochaetes bacterium]|nr:MAG: hypothetical protein EPN93_19435 [Spirochaetota bacterium]
MPDWIHGLPLWTAKIGAGIFFLSILVIAWIMPLEFVFHGAPDRARWRDLRIWATILVAVQCILYYIF